MKYQGRGSASQAGLFERFCYDALNRLTASALAAGSDPGTNCAALGGTVKTIAYDAIGDITSKSDAGTYGYPASGAGSVRPHAVGAITGTVNGVVNPSYSYDADGFMTAGAGRTITPVSFDMAGTIVQGATTVTLRYDGDHQRAYQTTGTNTTTYENDPASGAMEEVQAAGTTYTYQDYLKVDGHVVALRSCTASSFAACTATPTWTYVVTDQLGSTAVLTDASGTPIERDSTDPWGRPRVYATGADDASCGTSPPSATTHHFTGHESIASACLVNANARLYDPAIGRFLAADTMVSDALDGQAFNHFSYVNNGPLSATDPTGHYDELAKGPGETVNVPGARIPGFADTSDMPSGMVSNRGAASSGYGGTYRVGKIRVPVTFNITGTRIPQTAIIVIDAQITDETEQSANSDCRDTEAYRYTGPLDAADNQAAQAWSDGKLSDGTDLKLQQAAGEQGISVSADGTSAISSVKRVCVRCSDGLHEGVEFDWSSIPKGSYPAHSHTKREGDIPGPGDNSGVDRFGRAYVITPIGAFAIEHPNGGYIVRQIAGAPLNEAQLSALNGFILQWSNGGANCHRDFVTSC